MAVCLSWMKYWEWICQGLELTGLSSCIHINADNPETHTFYIDGDLHCLGEYVLPTGTELAELEIMK